MTHDTLLTDYIVTNKTVTDCGLYVYVQHPWEWGRSEDLGSVMWCDGLVEWSGVRVRTSPELVQSWGGRQWNNNMDTEAETPDYKDWGDYGQHWGVDRVKLQFKTGQQRPLSSLRTSLGPGANYLRDLPTTAPQYLSTLNFSICHFDQDSISWLYLMSTGGLDFMKER